MSPRTAAALSHSATDGLFDLAVLDPAFGGSLRLADRERFAATSFLSEVRAPIASAIVYTEVSEATMRAAVALATLYPVHVVCRGQRDEELQLRSSLDRARTHTSARLALTLDRHLGRQAESLRRAVGAAIMNPDRVQRGSDVASVAACSERTLERRLREAGFAGVHHLLTAARTARAHQRLQSRDVHVGQVARELGYASARGLRAATLRCCGLKPSEMNRVSTYEIADRLAAWVTDGVASRTPSAHRPDPNKEHTRSAPADQ